MRDLLHCWSDQSSAVDDHRVKTLGKFYFLLWERRFLHAITTIIKVVLNNVKLTFIPIFKVVTNASEGLPILHHDYNIYTIIYIIYVIYISRCILTDGGLDGKSGITFWILLMALILPVSPTRIAPDFVLKLQCRFFKRPSLTLDWFSNSRMGTIAIFKDNHSLSRLFAMLYANFFDRDLPCLHSLQENGANRKGEADLTATYGMWST